MNQAYYLSRFKDLAENMYLTTQSKNKDYAKAENAFANFEQISILTGGKISVEQGILVRMTDKLSRIANLLNQEAAVKEESIDDTLKDLAVYATILRIYRAHKIE